MVGKDDKTIGFFFIVCYSDQMTRFRQDVRLIISEIEAGVKLVGGEQLFSRV